VADYRLPDLATFPWQITVLDRHLAAPPGSPAEGDRYIVAAGATGAWATHDYEIAEWTGTAWEFAGPFLGMTAFVEDETREYRWYGSTDKWLWPHADFISRLGDTINGDLTINGLLTAIKAGGFSGDFQATSAATAIPVSAVRVVHRTSGDMADGFGSGFLVYIEDDAGLLNLVGGYSAVRDGADNKGGLLLRVADGSGSLISAVFIRSNGDVEILKRLKVIDSGGDHYTFFQGGNQAGDITYTLPTALAGSNAVLQATSAGLLSWITALADAQIPSGIMRDSEHAADGHTMTIDGVDVSAHAANVDAHHAQVHTHMALYDAGNSGATKTIDWANGSVQKLTLTANCTLTFSNPVTGGRYILILVQDGTGSRIVTWPATCRWSAATAPTLTTTAAKRDYVGFLYDAAVTKYDGLAFKANF